MGKIMAVKVDEQGEPIPMGGAALGSAFFNVTVESKSLSSDLMNTLTFGATDLTLNDTEVWNKNNPTKKIKKDDVIVEVNGKRKDRNEIKEELEACKAENRKAVLRLKRNGKGARAANAPAWLVSEDKPIDSSVDLDDPEADSRADT